MKIVESIEPQNADKTFMGKKEIKLTLDTENGQVAIDCPAMFTDPVVDLGKLQATVEKLVEYKALADRGDT